MRTARSWIRFALSMLLLAVFLVHTFGIHPFRTLTRIEALTYDARTRLSLTEAGDPRIVILDMDERTIAAEGWPWPRTKWAQLIDVLFEKYQPKVVGFDVSFNDPDRSSGSELLQRLAEKDFSDLRGFRERAMRLAAQLDNDRRFAEAIRGRPIVLGYFFKPYVPAGEPARTGALCPPLMDAESAAAYAVGFVSPQGAAGNVPVLQAATPHCGFYDNPLLDDDGIYRRVPLLEQFDGALYPSLALETARVALGSPGVQMVFDPPDGRSSLELDRVLVGSTSIPVDGSVGAYVPYLGPYRTFEYVSVMDVLHGTADVDALRDKIVVVGTSAGGLLDQRTTPVGKAYPGVEVHANLISGILDGRVRQKPQYYSGVEAMMLILIALALAWVFPRVSPAAGAGLGAAIVIGVAGLAIQGWNGANFIMPMGVPIVFTLATFMVHLLYGYFIESRGKRDISRRFGQYVPPELVEEMAANPEFVSMEGESREMTVLFSDVRGFTTISEKLEAKELAALMNAFLTKMTGVIQKPRGTQKRRGTIDKYMGDAIMAFWGAPLPDAAHAQNALEAGLEMVHAVRELDAEFAQRGWPPLRIGVGINTGRMNVGNMGSEFRMAYTVMGDPVNLGSRVEAATKDYGVSILCTEDTLAGAPPDWAFREIDRVRVKGKSEPKTIYEPLGPMSLLDPAVRQDLDRLREAMKLYREQMWDRAEAEFVALSESGRPHKVYEVMLENIRLYRAEPPGPEWDGATTRTHK